MMWNLVRSVDWSKTSLGSRDDWPHSLIATLRMVLASKQTICFWWGPELLQFHNEAYLPILGKRVQGAIGKPFSELWPDVAGDVRRYLNEALAGKGTWVENLPLTMTRNGYPEQTYWSFSYSPLYDDEGNVAGVLNITTETTQAMFAKLIRDAENETLSDALDNAHDVIDVQRDRDRERIVIQRELSHRLKNSFSIVSAIISQSVRGDVTLDEARTAAIGRIQALANAQDVLIGAYEEGAMVADVVKAAIAPHQSAALQVTATGPAFAVAAQQGMGLALAVHELATNAAKYGALSIPEGKVDLTWSLQDGRFTLNWQEAGGPAPKPSAKKGFGSRLLERIVPGYFGGTAVVDYKDTGVSYTLSGVVDRDQTD